MKQFKVGQKVRVKTYEEMEKEYPNADLSEVKKHLRKAAGVTHVISSKESADGYFSVSVWWIATPEMCEEVTDESNP